MKIFIIPLRWIARMVVGLLFRVRVSGLENYARAGERTLIVANHVSRLDGLFLFLFLPQTPVFAIDPTTKKWRWARPFLAFADLLELEPLNPHALKALVKVLKQGNKVMIFPEGRVTATGSLMKIYEGPAMVAELADAEILPIGIEGPQYSHFSLLKELLRLRRFPPVRIVCLEPRKIALPEELQGRPRRAKAAAAMLRIMREIAYENAYRPITLYQAIVDAMRRHGSEHLIVEDSTGARLTYRQLLLRANVLGQFIAAQTEPRDCVGIMLPSTAAAIVTLAAVQSRGRPAAMLNFTAGSRGLVIACETANVKVVYTSRAFIAGADLEDEAAALEEVTRVIYLEDLRARVSVVKKIRAAITAYAPNLSYRIRQRNRDPRDVSVILFTSGSEGIPKGVTLTHSNLIANYAQVQTLLDLTHRDIVLNVLPTFHAFGLLGGVLLPLFDGARIYCYPSPLHYRLVPEVSYKLGATCLFGTNTFLAGYAKHAHPYDFYRMRYVIAGAEKLTEETRRTWAEKFGVRVFEGYGATETSPVLAVNTPMGNKPDSAGQLLARMEYYLDPVDGIATGGRLIVRGPNVMRGYLFHGGDGDIYPPSTDRGQGWYDTGDIVTVDDDRFVTIIGRQKRFAKIAGEMVSLRQTEELAQLAWPDGAHAAVVLPDTRKGEQIVLLTEMEGCDRSALVAAVKELELSELSIPKRVLHCEAIPLLGSGKVDYPTVRDLAKEIIDS
jgi:acyl-[acyl-carrier-protein]-phospholipid O-acyltransferase / long-chain-fatty-acid--[acyl-carrier-protein] ligase